MPKVNDTNKSKTLGKSKLSFMPLVCQKGLLVCFVGAGVSKVAIVFLVHILPHAFKNETA